MAAPSGASGGAPLHGSVGMAFQDNLEHQFLDAAQAALLSKTPKFHFPLFLAGEELQVGAVDGNVGVEPRPP